MIDCPNVAMRESLPELLHEELEGDVLAEVEAHVAGCAACAAELDVLRRARAAMRGAYQPRIDTAAIVAALPRPSRRAAEGTPTARARSPLAWRIAAALAVVSLGGLSFAVARSPLGHSPVAVGGDSGGAAVALPAASETTLAAATPSADGPAVDARQRAGLTTGGGVSDLGDAELQALLGDLERLEAAPVAEPDALSGSRLVSGAVIGSED